MLINLLAVLIFILYRINISKVYFISTDYVVNIIKDKLFEEGFEIEKCGRVMYRIYPVLYGERK